MMKTVNKICQILSVIFAAVSLVLFFTDFVTFTTLKGSETAVGATLGFGIVGDNEQTVLCVPTEKQYAKKDWHYKFTAECEYEPLRQYIASRHFYFSDFCSFLKAGHAKLVVKDEFKKKVQNYIEVVEQEKKNKSYKVKKFFGLVEDEKNPYLAVSAEV